MSDKTESIINEEWFTLNQPWADSHNANTAILAGHPDPHLGVLVADTFLAENELELCEQQALAEHIVALHNEWLLRKARHDSIKRTMKT